MTRDWWKHLILILGAIIVIAPFYMMVSYSLKSRERSTAAKAGSLAARS